MLNRRQLLKIWVQSPIGGYQIFGNSAGFRNGGDEIHIPHPPGQNVHMQVGGDSGARRAAKIHPQVAPMGMIFLLQNLVAEFGQIHQFVTDFFVQRNQFGNVLIGNHHQMTTGIWKNVENHEVVVGTIQNKVFLILLFLNNCAKRTLGQPFFILDVLIPPGCPQMIHIEWPENGEKTSG